MFALVDYVEDNEVDIVDVSRIKRFDPKNVESKKKYKVQWSDGYFYDAFILVVGKTEEEVKKKRDSARVKKPNRKFTQSDVATSSETENDERRKQKERTDDKFVKLFNAKLSNMRATSQNETNDSKTRDAIEAPLDKAGTSTATVKRDMTKSLSKGDKSSTTRSKEGGVRVEIGNAFLNMKTTEKEKTKGNWPCESNDKGQRASVSDDGTDASHAIKKDDSSYKKQKSIQHFKKLDQISIQKPKSHVHSVKEFDDLVKAVASLTAENNRYRQTLKQKEEEIFGLKERNSNLQIRVIAEFDELRGIIQEFCQVNRVNAEHRENNVLFDVGYRREADNTIHLGRNVSVPCNVYDSVVCVSRTNAQFVKNCAIAVFGTNTLMASSVAGTVSNRVRKLKGEPARSKLDSNKLLGLKDIYQYYLKHTKKMDEIAIGFELNQVGTYVSQKIYELNRAQTKTQTLTKHAIQPVSERKDDSCDEENHSDEEEHLHNEEKSSEEDEAFLMGYGNVDENNFRFSFSGN